MTPPISNEGKKGIALVLLFLVPALLWLAASGQFALQSGGNSDVVRQWVASQYVMRGIDPYRVSLETLRLNFGETRGPDRIRLRDLKLYEVHPNLRTDGIRGVLPEYGPPTATYPPSSLLMLVGTVGQIPRNLLLPVWLVVNFAALGFLVYSLLVSSGWKLKSDKALILPITGALALLWPPTQELIRTSQFGFLVIIWLIAALKYMPTDGIRSGLFFSLALLKPSLALPFLILPLIRKRWQILAVVAVVHGIGTLIMSALLHTPPWILISEWTEIPRYMLQGAYTLQEVINRLGIENTPAGSIVTLGLLGAVLLWSLVCRRTGDDRIVSFLCFASIAWTYHERYDFVILLIPILILFNTHPSPGARGGIGTLVAILGLALSDPIYLSAGAPAHIIRWLGRLAFSALWLHVSVRMAQRGEISIISSEENQNAPSH